MVKTGALADMVHSLIKHVTQCHDGITVATGRFVEHTDIGSQTVRRCAIARIRAVASTSRLWLLPSTT